MTTRSELTDKLLENILSLAGNEEAKILINNYNTELYSFANMPDVSVRMMSDGSVAQHVYSDGTKVYPTELDIHHTASARQVLDKVIGYIDQLRNLGATQIVVGIRSHDMTQVRFAPPSFYYATYSFSGTNEDNSKFWCVDSYTDISSKICKKAA